MYVIPFSLLQKLAHDLRTTLSPIYPQLLSSLLTLLPRSSISASSLTALLSTFSELFKQLLIPSLVTHPELLDETWMLVKGTLRKCQREEVKRALGEVWGIGVLRRVKGAGRERCVGIMMQEGFEGVEDACAWMFVFACKVSVLGILLVGLPILISIYFSALVCLTNATYIRSLSHYSTLVVLSQLHRCSLGEYFYTHQAPSNGTHTSRQIGRRLCPHWRLIN